MKEYTEKWIIIDLKTSHALYGFGGKTFKFSSQEIAEEVANQLFEFQTEFITVEIN